MLSIYLILTVFIFIQSIFGIGLLVFGTPTLLLFGFSYSETLSILLPTSCLISLLQILYSLNCSINKFSKDFIKFSLLGLIIFLPVALMKITLSNLNIIVATTLIAISIFCILDYKNFIKKFRIFFLFFTGCIHGLTNLGGGLISLVATVYYPNNKEKIRKSIAIAYLIFGVLQLSVLAFFNSYEYSYIAIYLLLIFPIVFFFSRKIFKNLKQKKYQIMLYFIVFSYGLISIYINLLKNF